MSTVPDRLRAWERFAPLSGVVAVVLWVIAVILIESAGPPDEDEGAQVVLDYFDENSGRILAGAFLFMLGTAIFLWFLGTLRARIHRNEGDVGRISSIFFAAGIVTAAMLMGFVAPQGAAAFAAQEIEAGFEPAAAQALSVLDDGFFIAAEASLVVFFLAAAIAAFRTRAIPAWLAWASVVLAVAAVLPWVGWAVVIWGLPLWVLVVSVWTFMRPAAVDTRAASPSTVT
jgi:hypothetical protein